MIEPRRRYAQNNNDMSEHEDEESFLGSSDSKEAVWHLRRHGRYRPPRDPRCRIVVGLVMILAFLLALSFWIMYVSISLYRFLALNRTAFPPGRAASLYLKGHHVTLQTKVISVIPPFHTHGANTLLITP